MHIHRPNLFNLSVIESILCPNSSIFFSNLLNFLSKIEPNLDAQNINSIQPSIENNMSMFMSLVIGNQNISKKSLANSLAPISLALYYQHLS